MRINFLSRELDDKVNRYLRTHFVNVSFQESLMQIRVLSDCVVSAKTWFSMQLNLNKFSKRFTSVTFLGICGTTHPNANYSKQINLNQFKKAIDIKKRL
jgi:hypothetical protein